MRMLARGLFVTFGASTAAVAQVADTPFTPTTPVVRTPITAPAAQPMIASPLDAVLFDNGPLSTGATAKSGAAAPAGTTWSEVQNNAGELTIANTTAGYRMLQASDRLTDDFTVPAGQTWNVTSVRLYGYQTGSTTTSTITAVTIRILNGPPPAGTVVFGDMTTNRLTTASFSNIYRTFNTVVPALCGGAPTAAATNRPIMALDCNVVTTLPAGTYWIDWSATGSAAFSGPWSPLTTVVDTRQAAATPNSQQSVNLGATYVMSADAGQGCAPLPVNQDYAFIINGTVAGCYPDCNLDGVLTVQDFGCFQTAFVGGNMYADCNQSGTLTVQDFGCFQTAFVAGCP